MTLKESPRTRGAEPHIPKTMTAARMHGPRDLRIEEIPVPPVPDDGLLVQIGCCAICNGSDRIQFLGEGGPKYPFVIGHEASGEVTAVGKHVAGYAVGDRLTFWGHQGSFAQFTAIRPHLLAVGKMPDGMTYEQGALTQLLCSILRGTESGKITKGDRVLVIGQGPVGLLAAQACKALGASPVITVDFHENRLEMSRRLGADVVVNAREDDMAEAVRKNAGAVSVVFDAYGDDLAPDGATMGRAIELIEEHGRYILFGLSHKYRSFSPARVLYKKISLVTTHVPQPVAQRVMQDAVRFVAEGTVRVDPIITDRISLADLEDGIIRTIERPAEVIKVVVNIQ